MLAGLLLALALHLLIIAMLSRSSPDGHSPAPPPPRVTLRLIPMQATPAGPAPARVKPEPAATQRRPEPTFARTQREPPQVPTAWPEVISPEIASAIPVDPAASDVQRAPSLMDTEATRRAIRASARAPSLGEQLARAREEPQRIGASERLANDVRNAGKGECLKGEYLGAGMGLLSLPFLAAAAVRGQCTQ